MINYSDYDIDIGEQASVEFLSESTINTDGIHLSNQKSFDTSSSSIFPSQSLQPSLKVFNPKNTRSCGHINLNGKVLSDFDKVLHEKYEQQNFKKRLIEKQNIKESVVVICSICQKELKSSCALGGHMSRKHQNQSEKYSKKKEKERMRQYDREKNHLIKTIINQDLSEIFPVPIE